jgi:DNA (cytosine-5)-methyltransferase 1
MTHGSLFSGIGGFDLAAEWMGWENLFNCEWEEFPRKVLKHHFPNAKQYGDIKEFNATDYAGRIDILTGGFPCQPYSTAGKRKGKEDERHLWPEMLRVIRECSPRWVVGENVRGLVNWNGGLVFEEVCADLETCGYSVQPFILPACAVNAPHRRDRVWFVAHAHDDGTQRTPRRNESESRGERIQERDEVQQPNESDALRELSPDTSSQLFERDESGKRRTTGKQNVQQENRETNSKQSGTMGKDGITPDTEHNGQPSAQGGRSNGTDSQRSEKGQEVPKQFEGVRKPQKLGSVFSNKNDNPRNWETFPTEPPLCGRDDGLPKELDGITFPKWRRESIKAYGNAIVPQVALQIFKAIEAYELGRIF